MHEQPSPCWPTRPQQGGEQTASPPHQLLVRDTALASWQAVCSSLDKTTKDCFLRSCELFGQVHPPFLQSALAFVGPATSGDRLLAQDSALWAGSSSFLSTGPWWTDGPVKCPGILSTVCGLLSLENSIHLKEKIKSATGSISGTRKVLHQTKRTLPSPGVSPGATKGSQHLVCTVAQLGVSKDTLRPRPCLDAGVGGPFLI